MVWRCVSSSVVYLTTACSDREFHCASGQCILKELVCDQRDQCGDNSDEDEANCDKNGTMIYSSQLTIALDRHIEYRWYAVCTSKTVCPRPPPPQQETAVMVSFLAGVVSVSPRCSSVMAKRTALVEKMRRPLLAAPHHLPPPVMA